MALGVVLLLHLHEAQTDCARDYVQEAKATKMSLFDFNMTSVFHSTLLTFSLLAVLHRVAQSNVEFMRIAWMVHNIQY